MTEQEAEVWTARLTRIWQLDEKGLDGTEADSFGAAWDSFDYYLFRGRLNKEVHFGYWEDGNIFRLFSCGQFNSVIEYERGVRTWSIDWEGHRVPPCPHFTTQWLPFFHRGCWLSGCPIEATAHEKTEWMQGFSCEELEAWNLKM